MSYEFFCSGMALRLACDAHYVVGFIQTPLEYLAEFGTTNKYAFKAVI